MGKGSNGAGPPQIASHTGRTLAGQPLAFNHPSSGDLSPWFCWFNVADADVAPGMTINDCIINDLPTIRIIFGGSWVAHTADGPLAFTGGDEGVALFFGPNSRAMRVSATGKIKVLTVQLAAGAAHVMGGPVIAETVDRAIDHGVLAGHGHLPSRFAPDDPPLAWLATFERELAYFVHRFGTAPPDPLSTAFERCTLADPTISIAGFAEEHGVTPRTVERVVRRDFGLPPKQVLRRARALDVAAAMLGVAMPEEEAELKLRYYDQSHLTREVREFFDCTPRALAEEPHPLLRLNLETRQARRLLALEKVEPGRLLPWRDPAAQPAAHGQPAGR